MSQIIPLQPVASQSIRVVLGGVDYSIRVYQKQQGLFIDVDGVVDGVICREKAPIICREYLGFPGNLVFIDMQGASDPDYSGLGSRWLLIYLTAAEYALI